MCGISQWWVRWSVSPQMVELAYKIGKQKKISIKNECLFQWGKIIFCPMMGRVQCNPLTTRRLADWSPGYSSPPESKAGPWCHHSEDPTVVMAGQPWWGKALVTEPSLVSIPATMDVLLLSALNKLWGNWAKRFAGKLKTVISPTLSMIITSTVEPFIVHSHGIQWGPILRVLFTWLTPNSSCHQSPIFFLQYLWNYSQATSHMNYYSCVLQAIFLYVDEILPPGRTALSQYSEWFHITTAYYSENCKPGLKYFLLWKRVDLAEE